MKNLHIYCSVLILCSACSPQRLYDTGQAYQRNQCLHILDQTERERCLVGANKSYDDYKRETE